MNRIFFVVLFLCSTVAFAGPPKKNASSQPSATKKTPPVKIIEFGNEEEVNARRTLPWGSIIDSLPPVRHSSLIKIRNNFIPEVLLSVNDL